MWERLASSSEIERALQALKASGCKLAIACSGGAAGLTQLLWQLPGASRYLISSDFPYHRGSINEYVGRPLENYCSQEAAIALAYGAHSRGFDALVKQREIADTSRLVALGLVAALKTDRQRRGKDRLHLAVRAGLEIKVTQYSYKLDGSGGRLEQGQLGDLLAFNTILSAANIKPITLTGIESSELKRIQIERVPEGKHAILISQDGISEEVGPGALRGRYTLFPGSFNPLHHGHRQMAEWVELTTGSKVAFELGLDNADKPSIREEELRDRAVQFRGRWSILLTRGVPRFIDKARYWGCDFMLGADTAVRLLDSRFYSLPETVESVLAEFRKLGVKFFVFERGDSDSHQLRKRLEEVGSDLFVLMPGRWPISSTILREG